MAKFHSFSWLSNIPCWTCSSLFQLLLCWWTFTLLPCLDCFVNSFVLFFFRSYTPAIVCIAHILYFLGVLHTYKNNIFVFLWIISLSTRVGGVLECFRGDRRDIAYIFTIWAAREAPYDSGFLVKNARKVTLPHFNVFSISTRCYNPIGMNSEAGNGNPVQYSCLSWADTNFIYTQWIIYNVLLYSIGTIFNTLS